MFFFLIFLRELDLEYDWDFGNGITSQSINPIFNYNTVGSFPVSLTVTDTYGCSSVKNSDTIFVQEVIWILHPDITTSTCPPLISTFVNHSLEILLILFGTLGMVQFQIKLIRLIYF